jgi:hypothetical protein
MGYIYSMLPLHGQLFLQHRGIQNDTAVRPPDIASCRSRCHHEMPLTYSKCAVCLPLVMIHLHITHISQLHHLNVPVRNCISLDSLSSSIPGTDAFLGGAGASPCARRYRSAASRAAGSCSTVTDVTKSIWMALSVLSLRGLKSEPRSDTWLPERPCPSYSLLSSRTPFRPKSPVHLSLTPVLRSGLFAPRLAPCTQTMLPNCRPLGVRMKVKVSRPVSSSSMSSAEPKMRLRRVIPQRRQSSQPFEVMSAPARQKYQYGTVRCAIVAIRPAARGRVHTT